MATKEEYLKKAEHNERFFNEFDTSTTPYLDWVVTGIFYSAIHYIKAVAAKHGFTNISSYGEMDNVFNRVHVFRMRRDIWVDYRQLKDDSRTARYDTSLIPTTEVISLKDKEFENIKAFALTECVGARP